MRYPRLVSIALLSALAACGGGNVLPGGLGAGPLPAVRSDSRVRVPVTVRVVIGHRHHRHRGFRKPKFVSPGTNGFALAMLHLLLMAIPYVRRRAVLADGEFDADAAKI